MSDARVAATPVAPDQPAVIEAQGGCLCGSVRYRARTARARTLVCHCRACQRQTGSAFSVVLALPASDLSVEGSLRTYAHAADSGRTVHRRFCPACGSPVLTEVPDKPGLVVLKAGTLDDPAGLRPQLHLWCKNAQPWIDLPTDLPCLPEQPA